jgi:hypothetical protein
LTVQRLGFLNPLINAPLPRNDLIKSIEALLNSAAINAVNPEALFNL